jgi:hypothetical protein
MGMLLNPKAPEGEGRRDIIALAFELVRVSTLCCCTLALGVESRGEVFGEQGGESSFAAPLSTPFSSFPPSNMFPEANGRYHELRSGSAASHIIEGGLAGSYSFSPGMGRLIIGQAGSYSFFPDSWTGGLEGICISTGETGDGSQDDDELPSANGDCVSLSSSMSMENSGSGLTWSTAATDARALLGVGNLGITKIPDERLDCLEPALLPSGETDRFESEAVDARPDCW